MSEQQGKISYTVSTDIDGPILHFMGPDWRGDDVILAALLADVAKNLVMKHGLISTEDLPDYENEFPEAIQEIANRCFQDLLKKDI